MLSSPTVGPCFSHLYQLTIDLKGISRSTVLWIWGDVLSQLFLVCSPSGSLPQQGLSLPVSGNLWPMLSLESVESTETQEQGVQCQLDVPCSLLTKEGWRHCAAAERRWVQVSRRKLDYSWTTGLLSPLSGHVDVPQQLRPLLQLI